jgi:hypothetical protein
MSQPRRVTAHAPIGFNLSHLELRRGYMDVHTPLKYLHELEMPVAEQREFLESMVAELGEERDAIYQAGKPTRRYQQLTGRMQAFRKMLDALPGGRVDDTSAIELSRLQRSQAAAKLRILSTTVCKCCTSVDIALFYSNARGFEVTHMTPLTEGGLNCVKNFTIRKGGPRLPK